jgi:methylated-DNA-[protein]-cysteine S-methyltransferase
MREEVFETPLGRVLALVEGDRLCGLKFTTRPLTGGGAPSKVATAVRRYFEGDMAALDDVDVHPTGTPFQESVWAAIRAIPPGETTSYSDIAADVGRPAAVRAVGTATGRNPVWLIIPCHRVVRSDGSMGGYGGGLDRKRWLLDHEAKCRGLPNLAPKSPQ